MERFPEQFLDLMAFIEGLGFRVVFFFLLLRALASWFCFKVPSGIRGSASIVYAWEFPKIGHPDIVP